MCMLQLPMLALNFETDQYFKEMQANLSYFLHEIRFILEDKKYPYFLNKEVYKIYPYF